MSLHQFIKENVDVMVATEIAASGLAFPGVNHVINFDMPRTADVYVHRIGRTGRAGAAGSAISFVSPDQRKQLKGIERLLKKNLPVKNSRKLIPKTVSH